MQFVEALAEITGVVVGHVGGESSGRFYDGVTESHNLLSTLDGTDVFGHGRCARVENHGYVEVVDRQHVRLVRRHNPHGRDGARQARGNREQFTHRNVSRLERVPQAVRLLRKINEPDLPQFGELGSKQGAVGTGVGLVDHTEIRLKPIQDSRVGPQQSLFALEHALEHRLPPRELKLFSHSLRGNVPH